MSVEEVMAGAAWLDENFPGWERKIDLGTLDIKSCTECVLGQSLRDQISWRNGYGVGTDLMYFQRRDGLLSISNCGLLYAAFSGLANEPLWVELIKERFNTGNLSDGD